MYCRRSPARPPRRQQPGRRPHRTTPEPIRSIATPPTAGGLNRTELSPDLVTVLEERKKSAAASGLRLRYAGYADGDLVVVFTGTESESTNPERDVPNMFAGAAQGSGAGLGTLTEFPAGELGGEVRCTTHRQKQASQIQCGWLDHSTMGMLTATGTTEPHLAALLLRMRPDLEPPK